MLAAVSGPDLSAASTLLSLTNLALSRAPQPLPLSETTFVADASNGRKVVSVASQAKFTAVEFGVGVYDGGEFSFGALASASGEFATDIFADANGSDYLIDWIEPALEISLIGVGDIIGWFCWILSPQSSLHG